MFRFPAEIIFFLVLNVSRLEVKPTQPTIEWVLEVLPGGKRSGSDAYL